MDDYQEGGIRMLWTQKIICCRDHKGSGLSLVLEILSGALVGGEIEDKHNAKNWGCLIAAIDPALFGQKEAFLHKVQQIVARVKNAKREEGVSEILLPGERGFREAGTL